jgi:hypothetical protein
VIGRTLDRVGARLAHGSLGCFLNLKLRDSMADFYARYWNPGLVGYGVSLAQEDTELNVIVGALGHFQETGDRLAKGPQLGKLLVHASLSACDESLLVAFRVFPLFSKNNDACTLQFAKPKNEEWKGVKIWRATKSSRFN